MEHISNALGRYDLYYFTDIFLITFQVAHPFDVSSEAIFTGEKNNAKPPCWMASVENFCATNLVKQLIWMKPWKCGSAPIGN